MVFMSEWHFYVDCSLKLERDLMYQVILFKTEEGVTLKDAAENLTDNLALIFARDFEEEELFITLSISKSDWEDDELYEDDIPEVFPKWAEMLTEQEGHKVGWIDGRLDRVDEGEVVSNQEGLVLLYDNSAIVPAIVMSLSLFEKNKERILELLNKFGKDDTVDITSMVSPALYLEAFGVDP